MPTAQTLVIDGDDTLWENNIYFEQAIEDFIDFLDHTRLSRGQVRTVINEVERLNTRVQGYGSAAFARNLRETYTRLADRQLDENALDYIRNLAGRITQVEMQLLPGVSETLDYLSPRHRLLLFTKGQAEEQRVKVERSGLRPRFAAVVITAEKDLEAYRSLIHDHGLDRGQSWMIGNSPRSDIEPALAAGLGAVFIPHAHTWTLEQAELPATNDRLLELERFPQLRDHF